MRFVSFNDPHFTKYPPSCRDDLYPRQILDKILEIGEIADKYNATAILCTGDWLHRKGRVTYNETIELISVIKKMPCPIWTIWGNHDISGYNLFSINNRAPGILVHSNLVKWLDRDKIVLKDKKSDTQIQVTGSSYAYNADRNDEKRIRYYGVERQDNTFHIHLVHSTLLTDHSTFIGDFTIFEDLVPLLKKKNRHPDLILCGHLHFRQGIKGSEDVTAACIGSVARVEVGDLKRRPNCLLIKVNENGKRLQLKEIPLKSAEMDLKEKVTNKKNNSRKSITNFVKLLQIQADDYESYDYKTLIRKIAKSKKYSKSIVDKSIKVLSEYGAI